MWQHLRNMENKKSALLISGGHIDIEYTKKYISTRSYDIVIAVDGGLKSAMKLDVMPDYIVGDFDTIEEDILKKYMQVDGISIIRLNPEKDLTDTQSAIEKAIELSTDYIEIIGGTGTRLDHTIANIHTLQMMEGRCREAVITNENNRIRIIYDKYVIKKGEQFGKYVSFLPLTDVVEKITLKGFKYPLKDFDFTIKGTLGLGVSNEIIDEEAEVSLKSGRLIMIESRD